MGREASVSQSDSRMLYSSKMNDRHLMCVAAHRDSGHFYAALAFYTYLTTVPQYFSIVAQNGIAVRARAGSQHVGIVIVQHKPANLGRTLSQALKALVDGFGRHIVGAHHQ